MIKRIMFAVLAVALASPVLRSETTEWDVDSVHSGIYFTVRHLGIVDVHGIFEKSSGTVMLDDQDISKSTVNASVDVSSVETGADPRNKHLETPDFFDVMKFPAMTFQSTKIWKTGDGAIKMAGNLTIHGVTKQVTFDVAAISAPITALKATRRGVSAVLKINRKDFGMAFDDTVGDDVVIDLEIDLVKK